MTLETRRLGRTAYEVTALGLGAFQLTSHFDVPESDAAGIFAEAATAGIGYVDTAPMYAESEQRVGRALAEHDSWTPIVSTKVGYFDEALGEDRYRTASIIRESIERSRKRLGRERLDIVMIHEPEWPEWGLGPSGEGVVTDVLVELRESGVIGAIGVGGWGTTRIAEILDSGVFDMALIAGGFTLLKQPLREDVLPVAARHDLGVVAGGAFGQGIPWLLTPDRPHIEDRLRMGDFSSPHSHYQLTRRDFEKLLDLYDLADELGVSMTELTVRYILSEPRINSHIAGAREPAHLQSNLAAAGNGPLTASAISRIEA